MIEGDLKNSPGRNIPLYLEEFGLVSVQLQLKLCSISGGVLEKSLLGISGILPWQQAMPAGKPCKLASNLVRKILECVSLFKYKF